MEACVGSCVSCWGSESAPQTPEARIERAKQYEISQGRSWHKSQQLLRLCQSCRDEVSLLPSIRRLLDEGANPNFVGWHETTLGTPLDGAAWRGHAGVVSLLLERGADKDAICSGHLAGDSEGVGTRPLHHAAYRGRLEVARVLLDAGANQHLYAGDVVFPDRVQNRVRNTALDVAGREGRNKAEMLAMLQAHAHGKVLSVEEARLVAWNHPSYAGIKRKEMVLGDSSQYDDPAAVRSMLAMMGRRT